MWAQSIEYFKQTAIPKYFTSLGYEIKNYGCFDLESAPSKTEVYFKDYNQLLINNQTLFNRIDRDIGWNFYLKDVLTGKNKVPEHFRKMKEYHVFRNQYNWNGLLEEIKKESDNPRFIFVHLMLPHDPFFLKVDGSEVSDYDYLFNQEPKKEGYIKQLSFSNKLLNEFIPLISFRSKREKVIIIEGDHGFKFDEENNKSDRHFSNLNAYYFSDLDYSLLYDSISPVNSFRVVFNKYFKQKLPLLKDSTFFIADE